MRVRLRSLCHPWMRCAASEPVAGARASTLTTRALLMFTRKITGLPGVVLREESHVDVG